MKEFILYFARVGKKSYSRSAMPFSAYYIRQLQPSADGLPQNHYHILISTIPANISLAFSNIARLSWFLFRRSI